MVTQTDTVNALQPDEPEHPDNPTHLVQIFVNGDPHEVRPGRWLVARLKAKVGIDAALVLAEVTPDGLKDLADDEHIRVHAGEKFISHARSGGSS